ncbi:hypothetical protein A6V39_02150 [Candidatus Mycoplasma haematobovis]|uniref:Uncharacterized protein n=1 Tax=Candidatus Mycoplasma haematobovis TaxID=432608 RepID=A0A1A9QE46_9MOLU|nr:hypothetical protein [Candidatus Mycoplasma haematobovis]OAL10226.1 hypothetical protein A6V39_02150 [Candidatus Mycoplasma haematobovis]
MQLYIFHSQKNVICALYLEQKFQKYIEIEKIKLGEQFIETLKSIFDFSSIKEIYFRNSYSAWNASRLIVLFIKCCYYFSKATIHLKELDEDVEDIDKELEAFNCLEFKILKNINDLRPLYKECKNIDI